MDAATSTGLKENVAALLTYAFGPLSGLAFLLLEQQNRNVRFHAIQSLFVFGGLTVAFCVLGFVPIPVVGWVVSTALGLATTALWVLLMFKAYQGERFKVPFVGDMAEKTLA